MVSTISFHVPRRLDLASGNDFQSRIRSALRNGITNIVLVFDPACILYNAEFLVWLIACGKYAKTQGGTILVQGLSTENRRILTAMHLDSEIRIEQGH